MNENQVLCENACSFKADLKVYFSDFKVIEIGLNGLPANKEANVTNFSSYGFTPVAKSPLIQNISLKRHFSSASNTPEAPKAKKNLPSTSTCKKFPLNEGNCKQYLIDTFSSEIINFLSKTSRNDTVDAVDQELVLGEFQNKEERTLIHTSIRYCYPHLSTTTENCVIKVNPCSKFSHFSKLIGYDTAKSFLRYACVLCKELPEEVFNISGDFSKDQRRLIHRGIDNFFGSFLMAKTKSNSKVIEVRKRQKKNCQLSNSQFCKFVLYKSNTETLDAIQQLANMLKLRPHQFSYAGTKDKRAETWQFMTVKGVDSLQLEAHKKFPPWMHVSDPVVTSSALKLGDLTKNRFLIVLRNVRAPHDVIEEISTNDETDCLKSKIEKSLEFFGMNGFVNYFGPQRFGRKSRMLFVEIEHTHDRGDQSEMPESSAIGKVVLQQDFKSAVNILLFSTCIATNDDDVKSRNEIDSVKQNLLETGDIDGAIKKLPSNRVRELSMLRALRKFTSNLKDLEKETSQSCADKTDDLPTQAYAKALISLPHNALAFYTHSYCSLVWNKAAAYRLAHFGKKVALGDLVMSNGKESPEVYEITEQDVNDSLYSLRDVVLPLPGNRVRYPPNMESFYSNTLIDDEVLKRDSNPESSFRINRLRLNFPGSYRKLVEFPENLHFSWNNLIAAKYPQAPAGKYRSNMDSDISDSTFTLEQKENVLNLTLAFDLRPSCYATTFLSQLSKNGVQQKK